MTCLGRSIIFNGTLLGIVSFLLDIVTLCIPNNGTYGVGCWCGVATFAAGCIGLYATKRDSRRYYWLSVFLAVNIGAIVPLVYGFLLEMKEYQLFVDRKGSAGGYLRFKALALMCICSWQCICMLAHSIIAFCVCWHCCLDCDEREDRQENEIQIA